MNRNLIVVFLIGVILALLLPLTGGFLASEEAFTPDNLVQINLVAK